MERVICPKCGSVMNGHAEKLIVPESAEEARRSNPDLGGALLGMYGCPGCGWSESRLA